MDIDFNNDNNNQENGKKIKRKTSRRFFSSKFKENGQRLPLIPIKFPRYSGEKFEHYRQKYCGKRIKGHDFKTLEPYKYLNDIIINYYLELIVNRAKKDRLLPKVYTFNSFFFNKYRKDKYDGIKSWINDAIFEYDYILIPIHHSVHWFIIIVDVKAKIIGSFDSLGRENLYHLENVRKILITHAEAIDDICNKDADWDIFSDKSAPRQKNGFDCGVFACQYAQYITNQRLLDFQQSQMNYFRKRMQYELIKNKILEY
uniref:Ubiquitin-like protease family profile domain-containing protein n=1 Tax=Panagrolaimus sp. PS1159 TaxID=55785 RepID=A0AC35FJE6_9BILA